MKELDLLKRILTQTEDIFLKKNISDINQGDLLRENLGLDSLAKVTLFYEITDELETDDDEDILEQWNKVSDVLKYINENMK
ncbi:MAG: hypothetical protein QF441_02560 [Bacteriovoracaceae bacterium]|jgi:acyl carrier protein|nr:hypothetical protein [Halobacteriovoraceae bacterium]MDP7319456.1 hypothetical protein [Bacteriovoracaceae bacterium]